MKYEKVSLLIPFVDPQYGTYLQMKVSADVILEEGDTPAEAWDMVKRDAEQWHKSHYGTVVQSNTPQSEPVQLPVRQVEKEGKNAVADILAAKDLKELESFKGFAGRSGDEIQVAYMKRYAELQTKD